MKNLIFVFLILGLCSLAIAANKKQLPDHVQVHLRPGDRVVMLINPISFSASPSSGTVMDYTTEAGESWDGIIDVAVSSKTK